MQELVEFAKYVMQQFAKVSKSNPHVFLELLFWKTSREAHDIISGYGSYERLAIESVTAILRNLKFKNKIFGVFSI